MCALPEQFQGNSLALLQAVYRDRNLDMRLRIEAAGRALPYEVPKVEPAPQVVGDFVPLHERIREYARLKAIQATGQGGGDDAQR